ncbi:DUF5711 family protein [Anaerosalibacter massiliensis]|uniref:DUF5711 family protein n=1 Tax=Anaerosalibacter massiliensis TaxID=1347392 RepID=UPI0005B2A1C0|nr:DUF5711 family protein [Anaerosalibacter massiliensis]
MSRKKNVKANNKKKFEKENMDQISIRGVNQENIAKRNNNKNKKIKLFILIFIFATIIILNRDFIESNLLKDSNKTLQVIQKYPTMPGDKIGFYDDLLIKWNGKSLIGINNDGTNKWEKKIDFDNPLVFLGKDTIYVCESNTGDLYFLDLNGKNIKRIEFKTQIKNIVEKDEFIFITLESEEGEKLTVIDKEGVTQMSTPLNGERLVNFISNRDEDYIALSTLSIRDGDLNSRLIFYKGKGEYISDLDFHEEIITSMEFVDENSITVFTDSKLYFIEDGKVSWKRELDPIKDMYVNKKNKDIYILTTNTLENISYDNKLKNSIHLEQDYKKVEGFNKEILLIRDHEIIGFNRGRKNLKYDSKEKIERVLTRDSNIILITTDRVNIMSVEKNNN